MASTRRNVSRLPDSVSLFRNPAELVLHILIRTIFVIVGTECKL
jgi:hypothetical protein